VSEQLPPEVLRLAEDSNSHTPLRSGERRVVEDRYILFLGAGPDDPHWTVAQRLRLRPEEVEPTVEEVRGLVAGHGRRGLSWEVGSSATPSDLGRRLEALGIVPDFEFDVAAMVLTAPPVAAAPGVRITRVQTVKDHLVATRVMAESFGMPEVAEDAGPASARVDLEFQAKGHAMTYLGWVGDEPVAAARATFTPWGVVLNGGSTLPHVRGRGLYRALVHARWEDAVARRTPVLVTQAGGMSRPILERLGFRRVAGIHIYIDGPSA
jgi:hypothetical protein